jgi:hypothetical protein
VEEVTAFRRQAELDATCCGGCGKPLKSTDTVTIGVRTIPHPHAGKRRYGHRMPEYEHLRVPLCLECILDEIEKPPWNGFRGVSRRRGAHYKDTSTWFRCRCENCGRPIQRGRVYPWTRPPGRTQRVCCAECGLLAEKRRNSERRRVRHEPMTCVVCGSTFMPTRADATTCSNKCRQAAHRARNRRNG